MSHNNGIVYTKKWVVDLILDVLGVKNAESLIGKVIVDPSCGDGSFILRIIDLIASAGCYNSPYDYRRLHAYDIDQQAVEHTRRGISDLLIRETTMSRESADETAMRIAQQTDYITAVAQKQIPQADIVIGNPPYIRATDIPRGTRSEYMNQTMTMSYGTDIYIGFIEQGLKNLRDRGTLAYVCADRWLQNKYGTDLRTFVNTGYDLIHIIRMHGVDAFKDEVDAYPAITVIRNQKLHPTVTYVKCQKGFTENDSRQLVNSDTARGSNWTRTILAKPRRPQDNIILTDSRTSRDIIRVADAYPTIEEAGVNIGIGIATGRDSVFVTDRPDIVESDRLVPLFYMRDWRRGRKDKQRWLINPWADDGRLIDLDKYPKAKQYFDSHYNEIANRHVARKNKNSWYRTIDKIHPGLINRPKLLIPDLAMECDPIYEDGHKYPHHSCYWLTSDKWDLKSLGGILISDMTSKTIESLGVKMRGGTLRFQAQYLRMLHIPYIQNVTEEQKSKLATAFDNNDRMLANEITNQIYGMEDR
ncbi:Eco57I restriction-modification methylase domain-containing protein [Bifidobacterium crudilactis]|uniref:Eco57I restriction-modification methylase domain-containing protein n=1 Tax=Bifidobacterium crudilactis TaxID=327277 RepID=UPI002647CA15|nr:N-6 DNA methylase [Bifidobacterium crudilactis]MDN5973374.1 Eco57I restriction-modification methylase domain-containing protein [Bifidobacterium crudilactis]MDN6773297.1 Eco57I restriction-modification methylase domain-containing protein [Bifidobacterium crudilactis]